jgi:hypothetical protein
MSVFFEVDGRDVWNPSNRSGRLYVAYVRSLEHVLGITSGVDDSIPDDTIRITSAPFVKFVAELAHLVTRENAHRVMAVHVQPVLATSLVMLRRAAVEVPASINDVPILVDAIAAIEQTMVWP